MNDFLSQPVESLRYADGGRAKLLHKLGLETVGDLLLHIPFRYLDLSHVAPIGAQFEGDITCSGTITAVKTKRPRPKLRITEVALTDQTATVFGVWFNQPWVETVFQVGQRYAFAGTMSYARGMRTMQAPFTQTLEGDKDAPAGEIVPVYSSTEGLAQGWIRRLVAEALAVCDQLEEVVPSFVRQRSHMRTYGQALRSVHMPSSIADAHAARNRLAYQELFELSLLNTVRRHHESEEVGGFAHTIPENYLEEGQARLGVTFTADQIRAIDDVLSDMGRSHPMQRLLLGDVGTGKTFVALMALLAAAHSGTQAALMAPTEVLAKQHADRLGPLLDDARIPWVLITSSLPVSRRNEVLAQVANGTAAVVFGTHSLIQKDVSFKELTLAIIDEQHRFGVQQRKILRDKARLAPDMLSMTATPIPRSLALTLYGDLAISTLRQRPIKGAGVSTHKLSLGRVTVAHEAVRKALDAGQQAYIVCALIDQSSKLEVSAATDLAEQLAAHEYQDYRVALLHGSMKTVQKDEVMQRFQSGQIDVLVSTTVIEVGVDIHNATQMMVYNAERFGLAQLHQLRGRVGRGLKAGQMWLISDARGTVARERFEALCSTDDGFALADIDLSLRGAGDFMGTRQHGATAFRVADIARDLPIIELAQRDALEVFERDPRLEQPANGALRKRLKALQDDYENWVSAG